jgi:murein DD-endopeptidase MepM/ murein hydrolase activator NlpD
MKAAAGGLVLVAGYSGGYGNLIVIEHGNGIATA